MSEMIDSKEQHTQKLAVLEGLLFVTGDEGITVEQAAKAVEISNDAVEEYMHELMNKYSTDDFGFEIARYGDTFRFLSKAFVHPYAAKLYSLDKTNKLSQAAMETLAIIAYKQPITRVEIEEIRGVGVDMMLRKLMARGLIQEAGRSDAPGMPILYEVTDAFMDAFQLLSLEELPQLPDFKDGEQSDNLFE